MLLTPLPPAASAAAVLTAFPIVANGLALVPFPVVSLPVVLTYQVGVVTLIDTVAVWSLLPATSCDVYWNDAVPTKPAVATKVKLPSALSVTVPPTTLLTTPVVVSVAPLNSMSLASTPLAALTVSVVLPAML